MGRIEVQSQPGQRAPETPISNISRAKWTGGVAKEAECLLCNHEALSSNSSPTHPPTEDLGQPLVLLDNLPQELFGCGCCLFFWKRRECL
jgi:hypothetical protein